MNLLEALKLGQQLADPTLWAGRADLTAKIVVAANAALVVGKVVGVDLHIPDGVVENVALAVSTIAIGVVNVVHIASNKDAGAK